MSLTSLTPLEAVTRLSPLVIRVLGCNPGLMTLQGTNTYVIGNGPKRILVDAGERDKPEYVKLLTSVIENEKIWGFDHIVITHWHHDHIGGLQNVVNVIEPGFTVWKYPTKEDSDNDTSEDVAIKMESLSDGQKLTTAGATLRVIHAPGHTTDHICLYLEEENTLFSGDSILGEGSTTFETLYDYMKSLQKLLSYNAQKIFPAHGPVIENPTAKITEYIQHRNLRESQILSILHGQNYKPIEPCEIVKKLYNDTPALLLPAAERNVIHHLEKLNTEGKVEVTDGKWSLIRDVDQSKM
uniref:Beta-lactamase-like protein 2 homolog n=1 Tax=Lygus hesperus TaxID=30085 RepID=A0A0A9X1H6_LYGHE